MKRWNSKRGEHIENNKIDAFIEEVILVSKKHGLSIGHEDDYGAFVIEEFNDSYSEWLMDAFDATKS